MLLLFAGYADIRALCFRGAAISDARRHVIVAMSRYYAT